MTAQDADQAIANLCAATGELIVSSTPLHYRDPTHTNIHPQEYWTERFARHGFIRDVDYDALYIAPWAARVVGFIASAFTARSGPATAGSGEGV